MKKRPDNMNENSWIVEAWNAVGLKVSAVLSGIAGALVWLLYIRETSPRRAVAVLLMGAIVSGYATSGIASVTDLPDTLSGAIGFVLGLTCMRGLEILFNLFEQLRPGSSRTKDHVERIEENEERIKELEREWFELMGENERLKDDNLNEK